MSTSLALNMYHEYHAVCVLQLNSTRAGLVTALLYQKSAAPYLHATTQVMARFVHDTLLATRGGQVRMLYRD